MTWESLQVAPNIKLIDWAPQNDILAHPGVKLFLTQSGINSLYEAAYNAVPMVSVPIIGDQVNNAAKVIAMSCVHRHHTLICIIWCWWWSPSSKWICCFCDAEREHSSAASMVFMKRSESPMLLCTVYIGLRFCM